MEIVDWFQEICVSVGSLVVGVSHPVRLGPRHILNAGEAFSVDE